MSPGAPIDMVNARRAAEGYEPVDGFNVVKQRKKQPNGRSSSSEDSSDTSDVDFDVEIEGHHAMSKRTL